MEREKILCYIGLMKIDGKVSDEEMAFVSDVIADADISDEEKRNLQKMALGKDKIIFNLDDFVNNPSESLLLLIDLIALAKRDGQFAVAEKLFIKQIAKQLNFSDADITELLLESM